MEKLFGIRARFALLLALVTGACAAPRPDVVLIPIDHAGFAGRLRRVCELGKGGSVEGACATGSLAERPGDGDAAALGEEPDGGEDEEVESDRGDAESAGDASGESSTP